MGDKPDAIFQCQKCMVKWKNQFYGFQDCPKCGNHYLVWLNYEELNKLIFHN